MADFVFSLAWLLAALLGELLLQHPLACIGAAFVVLGSCLAWQRWSKPRSAPADDPRWQPDEEYRQLAGHSCAQCTEKIVAAAAGEACDVCDAPTHRGRCVELHRLRHAPQSSSPYRRA